MDSTTLSLNPRHSFSSIHEDSSQGWSWCMSKSYCKWPVIVAIIIAVLAFCLTVFCCLRCCGCFKGRRFGRNKNNNQPSMFNPMPYQGYQPANNNIAPPPFGQAPAQYAQFDSGRKVGEDSLPAMPSWDNARETRVYDPEAHDPVPPSPAPGMTEHGHDDDMEMGNLRKPTLAAASASSTHLAPSSRYGSMSAAGGDFSPGGYQDGVAAEADSRPITRPRPSSPAPPPIRSPYNPSPNPGPATSPPPGAVDQHYTGPDFSSAPVASHYTGPDFSTPAARPFEDTNTSYSGYGGNGTGVGAGAPLSMPAMPQQMSHVPTGPQQQSLHARTPSALQAGRRPSPGPGQAQGPGATGEAWRDI